MPFDKSVFINCPFDKDYQELFRALVFVCIYCGLAPKVSELDDSGSIRIKNIIELMKQSKYSIHDLSRMKSVKANELARFNMPFELGLDLGIREESNSQLQSKLSLVIDTERYRYQAAISDLSGSDIESYGKKDQVENLIKVIRNWFTRVVHPVQPSKSEIWFEYSEFLFDLNESLTNIGFKPDDLDELTSAEFIHYCKKWISSR